MAQGVNKKGRYIRNTFEDEMMERFGRLTRKDLKDARMPGSGYEKVYICSPYAAETLDGVAENVKAAKRYCKYAIERKKQPVASHLLYPQMLNDNNPAHREMGLSFGLSLLADCTEVWVFHPEGLRSPGMNLEIKEAIRLHIPVLFINDPKAYGKPPWNPLAKKEGDST